MHYAHCLYNTGMELIKAGQRYGHWTTLEDQNYSWVEKVKAKCDCGTKRKVDVRNLRNGYSKSCGKEGREVAAAAVRASGKRIKLSLSVGDRFGRLTVTDPTDRTKVVCTCDCGGIRVARISSLHSGNTSSCGCLKRETVARMTSMNASRGGLTQHNLFETWERLIKMNRPMYEPWKTDLGLFIRDVDAELGQRPAKLQLDVKDMTLGFAPGNLQWSKTRKAWAKRSTATPEAVRQEAARLVEGGMLQSHVAEKFGLSVSTVSKIMKEHRLAK